ncbi:MAG: phospholipase D-like domain-containing protein [Pseudomonadota bacterium]
MALTGSVPERAAVSEAPLRGLGMVHEAGPYRVFTEGDALYRAMLADIGQAQVRVVLESYIFKEDSVGQAFIAALRERAGKGVRVVLRLDAFGAGGAVSAATIEALRRSGVDVAWSRRWRWRRPWLYHRRNHRKLLLVDDRAAYLGGFNICAENSLAAFGANRWRDTHIRLPSPFVAEALAAFEDFHEGRHRWQPAGKTSSYVMANYGRACRYRWRCLLHSRFRMARRRIWLTSPYFVPDRRTQERLKNAARRGVEVKLLVPGKSDVALTQWAARASYAGLIAAGVKIYEYQDRVLHAKTMLIDDDWSTIGTSNMDYRSFFHNFELNFISDSPQLNQVLGQIFRADLGASRQILEAVWSKRPLMAKLAEFVGWMARRWL